MKKGDARREQILRTAEKLFYANGYEQTSVQDILDEIGISKGGFYHHFESKLDLLDAICQQRAEQSARAAQRAAETVRGNPPAELNALLDELAQIAVLGQTALGSGNEHTHALDGNDDAALVFFGDDALENGLVLNGILDVLPDLDRVEALLGKGGIALHVVDADDVGLDLVADMDDVLDLGVGIAGKLADGNVARLLAAQVDLDLGRTDGRDDTGHLISCI